MAVDVNTLQDDLLIEDVQTVSSRDPKTLYVPK
jgi:hypothetical protein